ncbi:tryptophan synthase subunit alpha [Buchnera aphidicola (Mollitrichosiphum nigrofasciatum)]|uniref:tryptophan synthase subunit alpha n=1 Tax=Buchnera aphidicola TaxID=9 RepID=UPI0031B88DD0
MNRYYKLFQQLKKREEGCFIPFVILGDPNIELSYKIINTMIYSGADALELGFPFSDPMADGKIIQSANIRALKNNINYIKCFELLQKIRKKFPNIPIGLLLYANIIFNIGVKNFYKKCHELNIDSILIVDVPIEESVSFLYLSKKYQIAQIFICPPNADDALITKISLYAEGYIYILSRTGVTGITQKTIKPCETIIKKFNNLTKTPLIQGFGIYDIKQIKESIKLGINGVICGSIIIQIIEKNIHNSKIILLKIQKLIKILKKSTKILC